MRSYFPGAGATQAQVQNLQAQIDSPVVPTVQNFSDLPDAATLPDGSIYSVETIAALGQSGLVVVSDSTWSIPLGAPIPTISYVTEVGAGVGELPESLVIGVGVDVVVGTGWTLDATRTIARPTGIVVSTGIDEIELGVNATGIYRGAWQLNYDVPLGETSFLLQHFLQVDPAGLGAWADVGELTRIGLALDDEAVLGISQAGLELNIQLNGGAKLRVVARHDDTSAVTVTYHKATVGINQILGLST